MLKDNLLKKLEEDDLYQTSLKICNEKDKQNVENQVKKFLFSFADSLENIINCMEKINDK